MTSIEVTFLRFSPFIVPDVNTLQLSLFCSQDKDHWSLSGAVPHTSVFSVFFYFTGNGAYL